MKTSRVRKEEKQLGAFLKWTKVEYSWELVLGDFHVALFLLDSRNSGKKRVTINNKVYFEKSFPSPEHFQYGVTINGTRLVVSLDKEISRFKLTVDGTSFDALPQAGLTGVSLYPEFEVNGNLEDLELRPIFPTIDPFHEDRVMKEKKRVLLDFFDFEEVRSDDENQEVVKMLTHPLRSQKDHT